MSEPELKAKLDRRIRLLKGILIPWLLLSIFGTSLALRYSYILSSAPIPLSFYADPTIASFAIWYLYGLLVLLTVYHVRLQALLTRRQGSILAILFIAGGPVSYLYLVYLWATMRQSSPPGETSPTVYSTGESE